MEAITNLLEKFVVFFVMRTGATDPDNVKERTQVLWMVPKNDYFLRFNCRIASLLKVMNGYGGKPVEIHFIFLKNFDRTSLLQFCLQISLSAPIFQRIVCIVDAHETFRIQSHYCYRVRRFGRNKKPMIGAGWESVVGDNALGKTDRIAFIAVRVFFAPDSLVRGLRPVFRAQNEKSEHRESTPP